MSELIFEPHGGFGTNDPDGEPWPFGYISEGVGRPVFELDTMIIGYPRDKLVEIATKMAAAPSLYEALEVIAGGSEDVSDTAIIVGHPASIVLQQVRAALALARGESV